jgi:hypothetical protein
MGEAMRDHTVAPTGKVVLLRRTKEGSKNHARFLVNEKDVMEARGSQLHPPSSLPPFPLLLVAISLFSRGHTVPCTPQVLDSCRPTSVFHSSSLLFSSCLSVGAGAVGMCGCLPACPQA